jgi:hypothetical protein
MEVKLKLSGIKHFIRHMVVLVGRRLVFALDRSPKSNRLLRVTIYIPLCMLILHLCIATNLQGAGLITYTRHPTSSADGL